MEHDHWPITKPVLDLMQIAPDENILDVGCGSGWLSRTLAKGVPQGRVVGMDISDEMIRHARQASVDYANLVFVVGEVAEIPWEQNFFTKAISVESSYYWPDPAQRSPRNLSRPRRTRLRLDPDQFLPRQSPQPSMGRKTRNPHAPALSRRMGPTLPRRRIPRRRPSPDPRPHSQPRSIHRPLVPRRQTTSRIPRHRRPPNPRHKSLNLTYGVRELALAFMGRGLPRPVLRHRKPTAATIPTQSSHVADSSEICRRLQLESEIVPFHSGL